MSPRLHQLADRFSTCSEWSCREHSASQHVIRSQRPQSEYRAEGLWAVPPFSEPQFCHLWNRHNNAYPQTSLVVEWIRTGLPKQGHGCEPCPDLRKDPTCFRATKPVCYNYWAHALEPTSCNSWTWEMHREPLCLEPALCNGRSHHNEKPEPCNEEQPLLATTRESLHTATKTQRSQK